jgi:energy-coupling factor transporter transmembrane protein EcfT
VRLSFFFSFFSVSLIDAVFFFLFLFCFVLFFHPSLLCCANLFLKKTKKICIRWMLCDVVCFLYLLFFFLNPYRYGVGNDNTVLFKKQALHIEWRWTDWISHSGRLVGDPTLIVTRDGRALAFVRGDGNALFAAHQLSLTDTQKWSAWHSLGGQLSSDPVAVERPDGSIAVFVTGYDNSLWTTTTAAGAGSGVGGKGPVFSRVTRVGGHLIGKPAVVIDAGGRVAVFARGIDNGLSHVVELKAPTVSGKGTHGPGAAWSDWAGLGGRLESDPAAGLDRWGALHVFVRGTGNSLRYLRQRPLDATKKAGEQTREQWDSWMEITGLTLGSSPTVSHDRHGRLGVLALDSEHRLQASFQEAASAWTAWETVGEPEQARGLSWFGRPAVTRDVRGRFMVLAKGADSRVYGCSFIGGAKRWSTWRPIEGVKISGNPVFASYPSGVLMILGRGTSNALWAKQYGVYITDSAEDWSPWVSLGGRLAA